MKKIGTRVVSLLLAAVLLCGTMPLAGAVDTDPPLYQYMGFESPEEFLAVNALDDTPYEWFSTTYAGYLEKCLQDEQVIVDYWGYSLPTAAEVRGVPVEELPQETAWDMTYYEYVDLYYYENFDDNQLTPLSVLSVQLDGETVDFPDAAPERVNGRVTVPLRPMVEALDGKITLENGMVSVTIGGKSLSLTVQSTELVTQDAENGRQTMQMDVAPYIKEGRTYISVRFFAEAFGYYVAWDEQYNTVVLYDRAALIASIDDDFTVVNRWLAAQPKLDPAQKLSTVLALALTYTELNSIDGNESTKMSGTLNVITEGQNAQVSVKFDLYALAKLLMGSLDEEYNMQSYAALGLLEKDLKNATFDMIYNADENVLYFRCPLLFQMLGSTSPELIPPAGADAWIKYENVIDSDLYAVYTGLPQAAQNPQSLTAGNIIVQQAESANQFYPSDIWSACVAKTDGLQMLADSMLTRSGQAYTAKFHYAVSPCGDLTAKPYETPTSGAYTKGLLTLHLDTGAAVGSFEMRSSDYAGDNLTTCTFSGNASAAKLSLTVHEKNQSIVEMTMDISLKPSVTSPAAKPPAADKVVDAQEWADSLNSYADDTVYADDLPMSGDLS